MPETNSTLVVANWKMNLSGEQATALARSIAAESRGADDVQVLIAPAYPHLERIAACLQDSPVGLAAQDLHWAASGAYTGAVSGSMIFETGATHVLVGHSERRRLFGDNGTIIRKKIQAAYQAGLVPIVCVGEDEEERDGGRTSEVITSQLQTALGSASRPGDSRPLVAYEPVWAIGTGRVAKPEQVAQVHREIRGILGGRPTVLYGGSISPANAADLLAREEVNGLLVGMASLEASSFNAVVRAAHGAASS